MDWPTNDSLRSRSLRLHKRGEDVCGGAKRGSWKRRKSCGCFCGTESYNRTSSSHDGNGGGRGLPDKCVWVIGERNYSPLLGSVLLSF